MHLINRCYFNIDREYRLQSRYLQQQKILSGVFVLEPDSAVLKLNFHWQITYNLCYKE